MNCKTEILETLSTSIQRARRKAAEQPEVMCHEMYAKSLRILYDELEDLPENHHLFERFDGSAPLP